MTSNQLPPTLLPYHLTSFPDYNGSAFGFGVMVIDDPEVADAAPKGEVRTFLAEASRRGGVENPSLSLRGGRGIFLLPLSLVLECVYASID